MAPGGTEDLGAGRLVIVAGEASTPHRWEEGLAEHRPEVVKSLDEAASLRAHDIVIVDYPQLDEPLLEAIRAGLSDTPAMRILTANHDELRYILRTRVSDLFRHVVPREGPATNVHALVSALRAPRPSAGEEAETEPTERAREQSWEAVVELLDWTVSEAVRVPGVVIRSFKPGPNKVEIQLVFRLGRDFEKFHCELPRRWRWPARARAGQVFTEVDRAHPTVQNLGEIEQDQEIFVRKLVGTSDGAYLAILPWSKDDHITVAVGMWISDTATEEERAARTRVVTDLYAKATREVPQFTLPRLDNTTDGVRYLLEYNWAITKNYVGPDRRRQDTSLVNRYMFVGRRKAVAPNVAKRAGGFVDRVPSWVGGYFGAYAALATIDTFFTARYVSGGQVIELNPVLAPLVVHHPWLFLLAKNVFALVSFAIIVRFHLFRRAKYVLSASVGLYAALDIYWAVLLIGPFIR